MDGERTSHEDRAVRKNPSHEIIEWRKKKEEINENRNKINKSGEARSKVATEHNIPGGATAEEEHGQNGCIAGIPSERNSKERILECGRKNDDIDTEWIQRHES